MLFEMFFKQKNHCILSNHLLLKMKVTLLFPENNQNNEKIMKIINIHLSFSGVYLLALKGFYNHREEKHWDFQEKCK